MLLFQRQGFSRWRNDAPPNPHIWRGAFAVARKHSWKLTHGIVLDLSHAPESSLRRCFRVLTITTTSLLRNVVRNDKRHRHIDIVKSSVLTALAPHRSTVLKILATCGCVQALPDCVKNCFEFLGALMLSFFGCLSFIWLGVGISISVSSMRPFRCKTTRSCCESARLS